MFTSTSGSDTALWRTTKAKSDVLIGVNSAGSSGLWLNWYMADNMRKKTHLISTAINHYFILFFRAATLSVMDIADVNDLDSVAFN